MLNTITFHIEAENCMFKAKKITVCIDYGCNSYMDLDLGDKWLNEHSIHESLD